MSKFLQTSKREKLRTAPHPPSHNDSESPSLELLKATVEATPGVVKNAADARNYLEGKNYLLNQQTNTITSLATILLSLAVNTGSRLSSERLPESVANVIKAVAYLMEEATTATYVDRITEAITQRITAKVSESTDEATVKTLQTNSDLL